MTSNQNRFPSAPARIEMLESRRLLSASPVSHVAAALVETPAVHVKPTIPVITGAPFVGTFTLGGHIGALAFAFTSESKTGALHCIATNVNEFPCTGTVKSNGAVVLHGKSGKLTFSVSGKLSTDHHTLSGKFTLKAKKTVSGKFTVSQLA